MALVGVGTMKYARIGYGWRKVDINEPVSKLYASYYHNLAVGENTGSLYTWGCGTFVDGKNDGVIPALGPNSTEDRGSAPAASQYQVKF